MKSKAEERTGGEELGKEYIGIYVAHTHTHTV